MAETDQLGIGILGAASIAKKNCRAIAKTRTGVGELSNSPQDWHIRAIASCIQMCACSHGEQQEVLAICLQWW